MLEIQCVCHMFGVVLLFFTFCNLSYYDVMQNFQNIYGDKSFYFFFNDSGLPVLLKVPSLRFYSLKNFF